MVGADEQTHFVVQRHLPAMAVDLGFVLGVDVDPVRQLGRPNRSEVLCIDAWLEKSKPLHNISGVNSTVMLFSPCRRLSRPSPTRIRLSFGKHESTAPCAPGKDLPLPLLAAAAGRSQAC